MVLDRVVGGASSRFKPTRSWKRSLAKTFTWRLFATADTFVISALVTGNLRWAGSIVGVEVLTKMMWYFLHERAWAYTRAGVLSMRRDGKALPPAVDLSAGLVPYVRREEHLPGRRPSIRPRRGQNSGIDLREMRGRASRAPKQCLFSKNKSDIAKTGTQHLPGDMRPPAESSSTNMKMEEQIL